MVTCGGPPRMFKRAMELHDSRLVRWELRDGALVALIDAYVHASTGTPGTDRGTGWSQSVELVIRGARLDETPRELPLLIYSGGLELDARTMDGIVPLPLKHTGRVRFECGGGEGKLAVSREGIALTALGEPRFVERFEGS